MKIRSQKLGALHTFQSSLLLIGLQIFVIDMNSLRYGQIKVFHLLSGLVALLILMALLLHFYKDSVEKLVEPQLINLNSISYQFLKNLKRLMSIQRMELSFLIYSSKVENGIQKNYASWNQM